MKRCFPIQQLSKAYAVPKRSSRNQKAHVLITYGISAPFATSLVRTKTLWFPLTEEYSKSLKSHSEENSPVCPHFPILGTFTPLIQLFYPHEQSQKLCQSSNGCEIQQPTGFKCKLLWMTPPSYYCQANGAQIKLSAPKLKHSQRMATTTFHICFRNESFIYKIL